MASHLILSAPSDPKSTRPIMDRLLERLRTAMVEVAGKDLCAYMVPFRVPQLRVGSLDSLVGLTDELARADAYNESVVRKAERSVAESYAASSVAKYLQDRPGADLADMPPLKPLNFYASGRLVHSSGLRESRPVATSEGGSAGSGGGRPAAELLLEVFQWDANEWDTKEPLPSLIRRMVTAAEKTDQELRACSQAYVEKKTALQAAERKRFSNLQVCPLEDHITPKTLQAAQTEWIGAESEFLASVAVVLPAASEEAFLTSYHTLDAAAVPLGPEGRRESHKGSPIVPGSARRLSSDRDGYVLYTLVVLRQFLDSFRAAAKERRWVVRDYAYVPGLAGSSERACEELAKEVAAALSILKDISRRRYEESLCRWLHVKMVRVHVDSVLRYGLPVSYAAVLLAPLRGEGPRVLQAIRSAWKAIAGAAGEFDAMYDPASGVAGGDGEEEEGLEQNLGPDPVIPGVTDAAASALGAGPQPFVLLEMEVRESTAAEAAGGSK